MEKILNIFKELCATAAPEVTLVPMMGSNLICAARDSRGINFAFVPNSETYESVLPRVDLPPKIKNEDGDGGFSAALLPSMTALPKSEAGIVTLSGPKVVTHAVRSQDFVSQNFPSRLDRTRGLAHLRSIMEAEDQAGKNGYVDIDAINGYVDPSEADEKPENQTKCFRVRTVLFGEDRAPRMGALAESLKFIQDRLQGHPEYTVAGGLLLLMPAVRIFINKEGHADPKKSISGQSSITISVF